MANGTDPNGILTGTWTAFASGRVLVGQDTGQTEFDVLGETGGAKTHTLTEAEMPSHTHVQDAHQHGIPTWAHATGSTATKVECTNSATSSGTAQSNNATATNQNTGGGGAHNNLQPYVVVKFWQRTA